MLASLKFFLTLFMILCLILVVINFRGIVEGFFGNNHNYRLGDIVHLERYRKEATPIVYQKFPQSIAAQYIKRTKKK